MKMFRLGRFAAVYYAFGAMRGVTTVANPRNGIGGGGTTLPDNSGGAESTQEGQSSSSIHPSMVSFVDQAAANSSRPHDVHPPSTSSSVFHPAVAVSQQTHSSGYTEITTIDNFSRGRVMNYLGRISSSSSSSGSSTSSASALQFEISREAAASPGTGGGVREIVTARLRLRLPDPHGVKVAEGVAETQRDAEALAAMHAEGIIDACGLHLFRLPSMQAKRAENARKSGRWAPAPDQSSKDVPFGTSMPLPLRMLLHSSSSSDATTAASSSSNTSSVAAANVFDPTENNSWQLVNIESTRFSPDPDTLCMPCIFDRNCLQRLKAYYQRHNTDSSSKLTVTHVAVPGIAHRMHVAEFHLLRDGYYARGKAMDRNFAIFLAAMHAELMLDALGICIYDDSARQSRHAAVARSYGRWAPDPTTGETSPPLPPEGNSATPLLQLPLPLKQTFEADELFHDAPRSFALHRVARRRSHWEELVQLHNSFCNNTVYTVEVSPSKELLRSSHDLLFNFIRRHNHRHPGLVVCTQLGDYVRAAILLPISHSKNGVRGGTGVGRRVDQAIQMASLHALDVLCSLGVDVHDDATAQKQWLKERSDLGLITAVPTELAHAPLTHVPFLPGYVIDPSESCDRPMPHSADVRAACEMPLAGFKCIDGLTDQDVLEKGIERKAAVQLYCRKRHNGRDNTQPFIVTRGGRTAPRERIPTAYNIAFLPLVLPERLNSRRLLAMGLALKKKDADRCCFLHAAAILSAFGVNPEREQCVSGSGAPQTQSAAVIVGGDATDSGDIELPPPVLHPGAKAHLASLEQQYQQHLQALQAAKQLRV